MLPRSGFPPDNSPVTAFLFLVLRQLQGIIALPVVADARTREQAFAMSPGVWPRTCDSRDSVCVMFASGAAPRGQTARVYVRGVRKHVAVLRGV